MPALSQWFKDDKLLKDGTYVVEHYTNTFVIDNLHNEINQQSLKNLEDYLRFSFHGSN